ncbi:MAG: endolytic transglycosylase MltG [bacterium]|nr:endolytic transglycosylase MltG [bacterium]
MKIIRYAIVVVICAGAVGFLWFRHTVSAPAGSDTTPRRFVIVSGEGVNAISRNLKTAGLIRNSLAFETYLWWKGIEGRLIAGEYDLNPSLSIRDLTRVLVAGETISRERDITILEGWTRKDIAEYLEKEGIVKAKDFLDATKDLEGYLFPDTYRIFKDATVQEIVVKMRGNFDRKVTSEMRADIKKQKKTLDEILIMASILEREVRTPEEMRLASDLFWRRVAIGMPLQSDATVNFVTGEKRPSPLYKDLEVDSPYNTYKYRGLPPGPIGNPGLFAITAAIYPKKNDYWFFLTTQDDGRAIFSKTFDEHNWNKVKYLK